MPFQAQSSRAPPPTDPESLAAKIKISEERIQATAGNRDPTLFYDALRGRVELHGVMRTAENTGLHSRTVHVNLRAGRKPLYRVVRAVLEEIGMRFRVAPRTPSAASVAEYLSAATENGDSDALRTALRDILKLHGATARVAKKMDCHSPALNKAMRAESSPHFETMIGILDGLDVQFAAERATTAVNLVAAKTPQEIGALASAAREAIKSIIAVEKKAGRQNRVFTEQELAAQKAAEERLQAVAGNLNSHDFIVALGGLVRTHGIARIAESLGRDCSGLHHSLREGKKPDYETVANTLYATGMELTVVPASSNAASMAAVLSAVIKIRDLDAFVVTLDHMAKEYGWPRIAKDTGLSPRNPYAVLNAGKGAQFQTINTVLHALGMEFAVERTTTAINLTAIKTPREIKSLETKARKEIKDSRQRMTNRYRRVITILKKDDIDTAWKEAAGLFIRLARADQGESVPQIASTVPFTSAAKITPEYKAEICDLIESGNEGVPLSMYRAVFLATCRRYSIDYETSYDGARVAPRPNMDPRHRIAQILWKEFQRTTGSKYG
jgi:DNA-binding phage protein